MISTKANATPAIATNNFLLGLLANTGLAVLTISITTIAEMIDSNIHPVWKVSSLALKIKSNTAKVM